MDVASLLSEVGQFAGLGALEFDDQGVCQLVFDGTTEVGFEPAEDDETLHIYSQVGELPPDVSPQCYEMLLAGNLFGRDTGGNVLSILPDEGGVFLCRKVPVQKTNGESFAKLLEAFVEQSQKWAEKITSFSPPASDAGDPSDPSGMIRV